MNAPRRITSRRLTAVVVLAAVFASGWFLGQPLKPQGCEWDELLARFGTPRYSDRLEATAVTGCGERPRIRAWFEGDWR